MEASRSEAQYSDPGVAHWAANKFIAALPPVCEFDEAFARMARYPIMPGEIDSIGPSVRLASMIQLTYYCNPLDRHLYLFEVVQALIRQGYANRDDKQLSYVSPESNIVLRPSVHDCPALATIVVGPSGTGKTTAVLATLSGIARVIVHPDGDIQIPYLIFKCPSAGIKKLGGLKSLLFAILRALDRLLKERFEQEALRQKMITRTLQGFVTSLLQQYNVGMLIMDESNNLSLMPQDDEGVNGVVGFFVELMEQGAPILFVGNDSCRDLLQAQLRVSRRASALGEVNWDLLKPEDEWAEFFENLLAFQWTDERATVAELDAAMRYQSHFIPDLCIRKFLVAQHIANRSGMAKVTPELITEVSKKHFRMVEPVLEALRQGNFKALEKCSDLLPYFTKEMNVHQLEAFTQEGKKPSHSANLRQNVVDQEQRRANSLSYDITNALCNIGHERSFATDLAQLVVLENPLLRDAQEGLQLALKKLADNGKKPRAAKNSKPTESVGLDSLPPTDLRRIVLEGERRGVDAYSSLCEAKVVWAEAAVDLLNAR